jgi:2-C-methyl-D-erythritol 4-phosphate cytidylyltransferase / 2-C-methyl-D-erythritol 2,4-cyclodiphosphate synthase
MNSLIVAAAGRGERFGAAGNKLLTPIGGRPLIETTLHHVMQSSLLDEIILVTAPEERKNFEDIVSRIGGRIPVEYADGGATRTESVANGLAEVSEESENVLIHDGARPGVSGEDFDRLIAELSDDRPAVLFAVDCVDTIKETDETGRVLRTPERKYLKRAQTPQGARTRIFRECMKKITEEHISVTDDASILETCGVPVVCIPGRESFFKITFPEDGERLETMDEKNFPQIRIGQGYDIHRFDASRPLILGGVRIRETGGLLGHSDADVLVHAVMDALLGAAGLPDIGHWFPDTDPQFAGISSMLLLERVSNILKEHGYSVGNIDSTILAEEPKMAPHIEAMRQNLADILHISPARINIKATTNETLGAIGRKEGIAAMASALVCKESL